MLRAQITIGCLWKCACAHTRTHRHTPSLMSWHRKLDLLRGERAKMQNVGGGEFKQWTRVVVDNTMAQKHNSPDTHTHTDSHKVHHSSSKRPVYFRPVTQKPQRHAGLSFPWNTAQPLKSSRCSTCHFQLVPQRESSATKRKMGAHYRIPHYFLTALKYRSGGLCLTFGFLDVPACRPCHTRPEQRSAEYRLMD